MENRPEWPPRYPSATEHQAATSFEGSPLTGLDQGPSAAGRKWATAAACGAAAYVGLLVVHLSTETNGSDAFRAGEVLPIAIGSAVLSALFAGGTWRGRRGWPWWLIALSVLVISSLWYLFVEVFPRVSDDLEAERSGEADYSVTTPAMAGDWRRLDSQSAQAREKASLAGLENAPDDVANQVDAVYGEYRLRDGGGSSFSASMPLAPSRTSCASHRGPRCVAFWQEAGSRTRKKSTRESSAAPWRATTTRPACPLRSSSAAGPMAPPSVK